MDVINLHYFDPRGRPSSAYVIRTWFAESDFVDGLYCARNKEEAFEQMLGDFAKHFPDRKVDKFELIRINGGIENRRPIPENPSPDG